MPQSQKRVYLPSVGAILLSLLIGLLLFVRKRSAKSTPSTITKHSAETSPESTLAYWTEEKMREAIPAPLPTVNMHHRGRRPPRAPRLQQDS